MPSNQSDKIDRRVSRTRRSLQEALLALILEKGYDAVTVEDITNRADLGRTTFYLHYHDKEDLLIQMVQGLVDDLVNELSQIPVASWELNHQENKDEAFIPAIALAFRHVATNADVYRVLLRGEGTYSAMRRVRKILSEAIRGLILHFTAFAHVDLKPQVPLDVYVNSLAGAWIGLMTWWLEEDMPYPSEKMAVMFHQMFMRSTREILGLINGDG